MAIRRRAEQEFEQSPAMLGEQKVTLAAFNGGLNNYTNPELLSPQFWSQCSNIYSGQFGTARRARFAQVVNSSTTGYIPTGATFTSMFGFRDAEPQDILLGDIEDEIWSFQVNNSYDATQITDGVLGVNDHSLLAGPWSRYGTGGIVYGMNGMVKRHFRGTGLLTTENWGLDSPDSAAQFQVQTFGGNTPLTVTDLGDRSNPWTNVGDFTATGLSFASANASYLPTVPTGPTNDVQLTNLGFALAGGPVFGIQFGVDVILTGGPSTVQIVALLVVGGSPVLSSQKTFNITNVPLQTVTFGGPSDTWNQNILYTQVNAANFGIEIYFVNVGSNSLVTVNANNANVVVYTASGAGSGNIAKNVGRSYSWAWENANIGQVSAPSPVTPFYSVTNQLFTLFLIQPGHVSAIGGNPVVTLVGNTPSPAWVNTRHLWIGGIGDCGLIVAVDTTANTVTVADGSKITASGSVLQFQVFDPQATHIRLYATSDGGAVYFRIQRNPFNGADPTPNGAGLVFIDNDNSEPPNGEFTSEIEQLTNLPPPIGQFVDNFQSRMIVYGVPGAPQSIFYSNFESTSVGNYPDCFAPLNQITFPMGDGEVFGTANLPTGFVVWSNKQDMFKITGLLADNTVSTSSQLGAAIQRLPYRMGCASPYAVAVTNLGAFWLTSDRKVMLFTDHYAPKDVGQSIQGTLDTINGARLPFAKMKNYRQGDRNWLELSIATGTSTTNNVKLVLDLNLLASNGQPSFFTFDMATNQPTWYQYDVDCEAIEVVCDNMSVFHTLCGSVDTITETDYRTGYFKQGTENTVQGSFTLHALGNEAPELIKSLSWMRVTTNQQPRFLSTQKWKWNIFSYDDDKYIFGYPFMRQFVPGTDSLSSIIQLENSPASFRFGATRAMLGRRFQFQTVFPDSPGDWELRSIQVVYSNVAAR